MSRQVAIVGGGPAGLATSYALTARGIPHRVYERARTAEAWRSRWDSFRTVTQRWSHRLPGMSPPAGDPEGLATATEIVAQLEAYASSYALPIEQGVEVTRLRRAAQGFALDTSAGTIAAPAVVVATGSFGPTHPPPQAHLLPGRIFQISAGAYRNPSTLPDGGVLVVGAGQSGGQIASELLAAGRIVHLALGSARWAPRRYRGRDLMRWLDALGVYGQSVLDHPQGVGVRAAANPMVGTEGTLSPSSLAARGARLVGRIEDVRDGRLALADGLAQAVAEGEAFAASLRARIDQLVAERGLAAPEEPVESTAPAGADAPRELDLERAGVRSVVWATGGAARFSWIDAPAVDPNGRPVHQRGISPCPGLYFVGLHWLNTLRSGLLYGIGEDAKYVASHLGTWLDCCVPPGRLG